MGRLFHIATVSDWEAAQASGSYTTSTRARTLVEEGFIHASRADQWQGVRQRFYADVQDPLVLLVVDTALLDAPVVDEEVLGSEETFPHIYGALNTDAVVQVIALDPGQAAPPAATTAPTTPPPPEVEHQSFSALFLGEVFYRLLLASVVLVVAVLGILVGLAVDEEWGAVAGFLLGMLIAVPVAVLAYRRREARSVG